MATAKVTGQLIEVERYSGEFTDRRTGESRPYSGTLLHILTGKTVTVVKAKDSAENRVDVPDTLKPGPITVTAEFSAETNDRGNPRLSIALVSIDSAAGLSPAVRSA